MNLLPKVNPFSGLVAADVRRRISNTLRLLTSAATRLLFLALATAWAATANDSPAGKPFSIQQQDGITWLVKPNGERFFSFGVCCVSMGASRKEFDTNNPGYAAWQHYTDSNHWAEVTLKRLKSWRFSTVGGWSDFAAFKQIRDTNVAFAPV